MSNIEKIITKFTEDHKFRIETKTSWNKLGDAVLPNPIASYIEEIVKHKERGSYNFTVVKSGNSITPYRPEEALERLILHANPKEASNQSNLGRAKKENIDLIFSKDSSIELIELKPWICGNPPIYGLAEIIKNAALYPHRSQKNILLTFLAPKKYYQNFYKSESVTAFLDITAKSAVDIYWLNINMNDFIKEIARIAENSGGEWQFRKDKSKGKVINFKGLPDNHPLVIPVMRRNWIHITNKDQWPKPDRAQN